MSVKINSITADPISDLQQMFELIKNQKSSWTNYINFQNQNGDFDILRLLTSAFFMQAITNKQTLIDYHDCLEIKNINDLFSNLSDKCFLLYERGTLVYKQRLYVMNTDTVIFLKETSNIGCFFDIHVLTFDRTLLEDIIKPLFINKGNNV